METKVEVEGKMYFVTIYTTDMLQHSLPSLLIPFVEGLDLKVLQCHVPVNDLMAAI